VLAKSWARMSLVVQSGIDKTDPTIELGTAATGIVPWSSFYETAEDVPELAWPQSVSVYNKMRNDEQVAALLLSFMLPIFGYRWYIDPNGARDEVVEHVATDFGLPIEGQEPGQQGRRRDPGDERHQRRGAGLARVPARGELHPQRHRPELHDGRRHSGHQRCRRL
jgi:hypothetical protein